MNKIALWFSVGVDDRTVETAIISSNGCWCYYNYPYKDLFCTNVKVCIMNIKTVTGPRKRVCVMAFLLFSC